MYVYKHIPYTVFLVYYNVSGFCICKGGLEIFLTGILSFTKHNILQELSMKKLLTISRTLNKQLSKSVL